MRGWSWVWAGLLVLGSCTSAGSSTGPRCAEDDPDCGPIPYLDTNQQPPPAERTAVDPIDSSREPCSHDGQCIVNGCGNECDHWSLGGRAGTCPLYGKYRDAYCGCVEQRCAWFH
ncbi:MAG TPA: hypothetical protein VJV78_40585 [Polyangiales bacterium]|nr:hypothetical protein [Polyangiales bacterium]